MSFFFCRVENNGDVYVWGDNCSYDKEGNLEYRYHSQWTFPKGHDLFNLTYEEFIAQVNSTCSIITSDNGKIISITHGN
jgi:hypothetical protein